MGIIVSAYRQKIIMLKEVDLAFETIIERSDIWISGPFVRQVWKALKAEQESTNSGDPSHI